MNKIHSLVKDGFQRTSSERADCGSGRDSCSAVRLCVPLGFTPLPHRSLLPQQFQSFSQYRCKTAKKSEEEIDFLRSNPKIWNVHSVLNVLHSLVDKSNINRQLEVYTSGGERCPPSVPQA